MTINDWIVTWKVGVLWLTIHLWSATWGGSKLTIVSSVNVEYFLWLDTEEGFWAMRMIGGDIVHWDRVSNGGGAWHWPLRRKGHPGKAKKEIGNLHHTTAEPSKSLSGRNDLGTESWVLRCIWPMQLALGLSDQIAKPLPLWGLCLRNCKIKGKKKKVWGF